MTDDSLLAPKKMEDVQDLEGGAWLSVAPALSVPQLGEVEKEVDVFTADRALAAHDAHAGSGALADSVQEAATGTAQGVHGVVHLRERSDANRPLGAGACPAGERARALQARPAAAKGARGGHSHRHEQGNPEERIHRGTSVHEAKGG